MRYLGVAAASTALVLGVAGNAAACSIRDFSAKAACVDGKGVIEVTDVDPTGVTAEITVFLTSNGGDERRVGKETIKDSTAKGVTVTFEEDWEPNAEYRVHVEAKGYVDEDIKPNLKTPSEACAESDEPPASGNPEPSEEPSEEPSKPSDDASTPADDGAVPAPSPGEDSDGNVPSPAGKSNLADTGADSNTPVIAGVAAAFLAVGGGAMYYGMRRRGASTR